MTDLTTRLAELKADMDEIRVVWGLDDDGVLIGSQSEIAGLREQVLALIAAVEGVVAVHRRAHAAFSWQAGSRYEDPCPDCDGKAGVHDCGCWADSDIEYVCAECHRLGSGAIGVYDYTWPCPTVQAITEALGVSDA